MEDSPAAHEEHAVVEAKAALGVEEKLPTAFEMEVTAFDEEPCAMAVEALEAPIEESVVVEDVPVEEEEVLTAVEEEVAAPFEVRTSPVATDLVVEEDATDEEDAVIEPEAGPVVQALPIPVNSKYKVFLSHSQEQRAFVERLCVALEGCYLRPFFDKRDHSLPIAENFPHLIFDAIKECHVGVVVLSDKFFTSKWPMMELVAMMEESRRRSFTIIPVFHSISIKEFDDPKNCERWVLEWHKLAKNNPKRVEVGKWEATLKDLRPINGFVYDGLSELSLENKIVDKICDLVPPEIRLDDMHIQGREHLCKVIQDKIDALQETQMNGICTMGLHGVGGIGKTSICKVLCNKFFNKFSGRVCHVELGKKSEEELMREVVKKLTGTNYERLKEFNVDQLSNLLKEGIIRGAVFLAIDNMLDTEASIKQAKSYLSARLCLGSIVMVTARSKDFLKKLRPYIDESKCLEMPELKVEHAEMLFAKASDFEPRNEEDRQLLKRCIKQCYFQKGDGNKCSHYHPLALDVLGRHLGCMDPNKWGSELKKIDRIGDHSRTTPTTHSAIEDNDSKVYYSIFSILRTSYDSLSGDEQMLFMDVALFFSERTLARSHLEWLGMVHRIPSRENVMTALGRLKSKSLLEITGDGIETSISMHDLWRVFCVAETKSGELRCRRWVYEAGRASELAETNPGGTCWESVKRIAFLDCKLEYLERVNFAHFPNVRVLKITKVCMTRKLVVDLSGLIHLKSLEVSGRHLQRLVLQGLPRGLICLHLISDLDGSNESDSSRHPITQVRGVRNHRQHWRSNSRQLIEQIACLKDLYCLIMVGYGGGQLPDMGSMVSMRAARFDGCENATILTGLSCRMTSLQSLSLSECKKLRSCPGLSDQVHLKFLDFEGCLELKRLPNLRKLRSLRILIISKCPLIVEVPGLDDLVALTHFLTGGEGQYGDDVKSLYSLKLPDLSKLSNLEVLSLPECRLKAIPGFHTLISLQTVKADLREVEDRPSLAQLTKLQTLSICGWISNALAELDNFLMLQSLDIAHCSGVDNLPDVQRLTSLQFLEIRRCEFKDVSGLSTLTALKRLLIGNCSKLERLPDLQRLTGLQWVSIYSCAMAKGWDWTLGVPVHFTELRTLILDDCNNFDDLTGIQAFSELEKLVCSGLPVTELPDLSSFPRLKSLTISRCSSLRGLTCREPMNALSELRVEFCSSLVSVPDLCDNFPGLLNLVIKDYHECIPWFNIVPLTALQALDLRHCKGLEVLPDLENFPALEKLVLGRCRRLKALSSSVPLPALNELDARECTSLRRDDLDQLQALCPQCEIKYPIENTLRSRLLGWYKRH